MKTNKLAVGLLRAAGTLLATVGTLFTGTTAYVFYAIAPELIVAGLVGLGMLTASIYLFKKATKISRA